MVLPYNMAHEGAHTINGMISSMFSRLTVRTAAAALVAGTVLFGAPGAPVSQAAASEIRYIINNLPVTSYDIQRRAAFLRLQRQRGNLAAKAEEEMVTQALRTVEMKRLNINIPQAAVDQSYERFASSNKLSTKQLTQILQQSGVTSGHFKEFIRVQMGWNAALGARFRAEGRMSEQDVVQKMLQNGGNKPKALEYMLQQVIFVVPPKERKSLMGKRRREAESMRQRFNGCDSTRQFAKGLIDVTVRDLGRVLEPELPPDWEKLIKATSQGQATKVRDTDRGVEFIGICSTREVSDDRVAQMVFTNEGDMDEKAKAFSDKYTKELRDKARIVKR